MRETTHMPSKSSSNLSEGH